MDHHEPAGRVFVSKPRQQGLWKVKELLFTNTPDMCLGHFVVGFGQDLSGEVYVLTSDTQGPSGNTGKVYKLVRRGRRYSARPAAASMRARHRLLDWKLGTNEMDEPVHGPRKRGEG